MFTAAKFNKGGGATFNYRLPEGAPYIKLSSVPVGKVIPVKALYISTKGKYGESPILITDDTGVYLPGHLVDTIREMCKDPECVEAINSGLVGAEVYEYDGQNGKGFSVRWVDVPAI